ncbi:DNA replication protein DnaD [Jeotgalicoccus saudimassiliensis]|uniref:DNA replication protein DnaD n=1 Tax=Jeotgalicoccus saudimassiliensis TaxID=1461582 RepID=A0A078M4G9_9STAP|nr:DnaD domain protein [Jeotgalicoccus saudimassiliensis]CEA00227.1 DNA replication protein DnaD [Jeotgalicoccus saudimassiliensis]
MVNDYLKYITVPVNKILLDNYAAIGLDERGVIILIKLLERHRTYNTPLDFSELLSGTTLNESELTHIIQSLIKERLMELDTHEIDGKYTETYNFDPLYAKLEDFIMLEEKAPVKDDTSLRELFEYIEQLYGRAISPNEYQRLNSWMNDSNYQPEQIQDAVDIAYKSNITSLQYVERILSSTSKSEPVKGTGLPVISWLDGGSRLDNK